jgi:hypothetical protein
MGITMGLMKQLKERNVLSRSGLKVLDIGSSNLYQATAKEITDYVTAFGGAENPAALNKFAQRLAKGSAYDSVTGGINESFAGELIERCGMSYLSMDIAKGYKTEVMDLNREDLPTQHQGAYDVVMNIGTTEHVFNQYNSFKVVHEAAHVGSYMVHQLPASGYTDHGYYMYAGRFFFELAAYNKYEITDVWYDGPAGDDDLYLSLRRYAALNPAVLAKLSMESPVKIPNYMITVIYKKTQNLAFAGALETSTSVGDIPVSVSSAYAASTTDKLKASLRGSQFVRNNSGVLRAIRNFFRKGS